MHKHSWKLMAGALAVALALPALTVRAQGLECRAEDMREECVRLRATLAELQARLASERDAMRANIEAQTAALRTRVHALTQEAVQRAIIERGQRPIWVTADSNASVGWIGIGIKEITADRAKELKLPAVRGVEVGEVEPDSPAAKAGLKEGDVITTYAGHELEGTLQFQRLVRETPAGRTVPLTIWRDGRSQNITVETGSRESELRGHFRNLGPNVQSFSFGSGMPDVLRGLENNVFVLSQTPRLGITAQDLSGQLGNYFAAPEGEGVLVTEVEEGTPAAKAGMKAGDVIIKINGERVRSVGDLRGQMRENREKKSVTVGLLRKGAELSLTVVVEQPEKPKVKVRELRSTV